MLIHLNRSGGFAALPGLQLNVSVDTGTMPEIEAQQLESAVRQARVADLAQQSATPAGPPRAGDRYVYDLTVDDGTDRHTVTLTEPFADPALDNLIDLLSTYS